MILNQLTFLLFETDFLRSIGKIYSVALVSLIVWIGIVIFLVRLEKKVKKIEDQMN